MSREVIHMHGEDIVVREDTAKAFRGVNWATASIIAFGLITAVLMIVLFFAGTVGDRELQSPTDLTYTVPQ